jgi:hypothetical protein
MSEVLSLFWPLTANALVLWQLFGLPLFLIVSYPLAVQVDRAHWAWVCAKPVTVPLAALAGLVDIYLNFTTFSLYLWDMPQAGELTLSTRTSRRLQFYADWRGDVARVIKAYCNFFRANHI